MNKQETLVVVLLFALLMGWMWNENRQARERLARQEPEQETIRPAPADEPVPPVSEVAEEPAPPAVVEAAEPEDSGLPELRLTNRVDGVQAVFSSKGGVLLSLTLLDPKYRREIDPDSEPTRFDFTDAPAFLLEGVPGIGRETDFSLEPLPGDKGVRMQARGADGLEVDRKVKFTGDFRLSIRDRFTHTGGSPLLVGTNGVTLGAMFPGASRSDLLAIDTLPAVDGRKKVRHWENRDLPALFGVSGGGCGRRPTVDAATPLSARGEDPRPQLWAALKNRFFVQLLRSEVPNDGIEVYARRDPDKSDLVIDRVHAVMRFPPMALDQGETVEREYTAYVGPKKLSLLRRLGHGEDGIMQFGFFAWMCRILLPTLNGLHRLFPNYGVAIILLTILVRILFWPITHRSTESMKKMQEIQPLVKDLQKKYKDNPQQLQQETWKLYREKKVNPMASCLPMLVQIPVFIALFTVLRSAVELRFESFLWVRDLSEPENLLAGVLPLPLNILPLLMSATMAWQQHLTPSAGDPQQKKMMMFMPVMMLFFFYTMPSALVLYWTTSQVVSIGQMLLQRRRQASRQSGEGGDGAGQVVMTRQMRRNPKRAKSK